eukprot:CAMPEP_0198329786 /NCGR_PEP_ID=MMETSP1450-20131203/16449_1 /TAXON_ID=753684 ORGANISM="Madagascaria erythrocladiodes, Strain CCMP3234" /NCGR_SAMPLE_ID=MMETSP1450 /ASSEMBLY_ACC=CAM_ASM_001115 /LENGTH=1401 /DNA_ID=CAMNT_0044034035 /DNA_START=61 /DNA_END=4263 /DNA_ORIENTATION=+
MASFEALVVVTHGGKAKRMAVAAGEVVSVTSWKAKDKLCTAATVDGRQGQVATDGVRALRDVRVARAKYGFTAKKDDQVGFHEGDTLFICAPPKNAKKDDNWTWALVAPSAAFGRFPTSYATTAVADDDDDRRIAAVRTALAAAFPDSGGSGDGGRGGGGSGGGVSKSARGGSNTPRSAASASTSGGGGSSSSSSSGGGLNSLLRVKKKGAFLSPRNSGTSRTKSAPMRRGDGGDGGGGSGSVRRSGGDGNERTDSGRSSREGGGYDDEVEEEEEEEEDVPQFVPPEAQEPVFGVPLGIVEKRIQALFAQQWQGNELARPQAAYAIVDLTIAFLDEHGGDVDDLFITAAPRASLSGFKAMFDTGQGKFPPNTDPHVVANLLLEWLRTLPEALLTSELVPKFLSCTTGTHVREALVAMPMINKLVLSRVMLFVSRHVARASVRDATYGKRTIDVFRPILFGPRFPFSTDQIRSADMVLKALVQRAAVLFATNDTCPRLRWESKELMKDAIQRTQQAQLDAKIAGQRRAAEAARAAKAKEEEEERAMAAELKEEEEKAQRRRAGGGGSQDDSTSESVSGGANANTLRRSRRLTRTRSRSSIRSEGSGGGEGSAAGDSASGGGVGGSGSPRRARRRSVRADLMGGSGDGDDASESGSEGKPTHVRRRSGETMQAAAVATTPLAASSKISNSPPGAMGDDDTAAVVLSDSSSDDGVAGGGGGGGVVGAGGDVDDEMAAPPMFDGDDDSSGSDDDDGGAGGGSSSAKPPPPPPPPAPLDPASLRQHRRRDHETLKGELSTQLNMWMRRQQSRGGDASAAAAVAAAIAALDGDGGGDSGAVAAQARKELAEAQAAARQEKLQLLADIEKMQNQFEAMKAEFAKERDAHAANLARMRATAEEEAAERDRKHQEEDQRRARERAQIERLRADELRAADRRKADMKKEVAAARDELLRVRAEHREHIDEVERKSNQEWQRRLDAKQRQLDEQRAAADEAKSIVKTLEARLDELANASGHEVDKVFRNVNARKIENLEQRAGALAALLEAARRERDAAVDEAAEARRAAEAAERARDALRADVDAQRGHVQRAREELKSEREKRWKLDEQCAALNVEVSDLRWYFLSDAEREKAEKPKKDAAFIMHERSRKEISDELALLRTRYSPSTATTTTTAATATPTAASIRGMGLEQLQAALVAALEALPPEQREGHALALGSFMAAMEMLSYTLRTKLICALAVTRARAGAELVRELIAIAEWMVEKDRISPLDALDAPEVVIERLLRQEAAAAAGGPAALAAFDFNKRLLDSLVAARRRRTGKDESVALFEIVGQAMMSAGGSSYDDIDSSGGGARKLTSLRGDDNVADDLLTSVSSEELPLPTPPTAGAASSTPPARASSSSRMMAVVAELSD